MLSHNAVHAAMAGYTGITVGWGPSPTPSCELVRNRPRLQNRDPAPVFLWSEGTIQAGVWRMAKHLSALGGTQLDVIHSCVDMEFVHCIPLMTLMTSRDGVLFQSEAQTFFDPCCQTTTLPIKMT